MVSDGTTCEKEQPGEAPFTWSPLFRPETWDYDSYQAPLLILRRNEQRIMSLAECLQLVNSHRKHPNDAVAEVEESNIFRVNEALYRQPPRKPNSVDYLCAVAFFELGATATWEELGEALDAYQRTKGFLEHAAGLDQLPDEPRRGKMSLREAMEACSSDLAEPLPAATLDHIRAQVSQIIGVAILKPES